MALLVWENLFDEGRWKAGLAQDKRDPNPPT